MNLKAEQAEATRAALVGAARELFAERGYGAVGTEEIVKRARVTRGALYHHFKGKDDLFGAVVELVEAELLERIGAQVAQRAATDPVDALLAGADAFLDASAEPEVQRILLLDAPSVLGWERWREIAEQSSLGLVMGVLEVAMEAGGLTRRPVRPLAHMLIGALDEGAMLVARADDDGETRRAVGEMMQALVAGLRAEHA